MEEEVEQVGEQALQGAHDLWTKRCGPKWPEAIGRLAGKPVA